MFDFVFNWHADLSIGIDKIDEQHKALFKIGRDMEQLLQRQCIGVTDKQLLDIICALREYAAYHFYEEELLMEKGGYSKLEEHKAEHNKFADYITMIDCPKIRTNPNLELKKMKNDVQNHIFEHILNEDMQMAKELRGRHEYLESVFVEQKQLK